MYKIRDRLLTPGNKIVCRIARIESGATRGLLILVARLTAREHKRIFSLCHYFAIMTPVAENESRHLGQNEMAGLKGNSGFSRQHERPQAPRCYQITFASLIRIQNFTVKRSHNGFRSL